MLREREFKALIEQIEKGEGIRLRVDTGFSNQTLSIRNLFGDMVLQFKVVPNEKLVIQHMAFRNQRNGIGALTLEALTTYAKENHLYQIMIENGNTPSIVAFAKKYGFQEVKGEVYINKDGILYGNYLLQLTGEEN